MADPAATAETQRLISDNQRLLDTLADLVTHYHGNYEQQEQLRSDFSGPDGLQTHAQVRDLVWQNACAVLAEHRPVIAHAETTEQSIQSGVSR